MRFFSLELFVFVFLVNNFQFSLWDSIVIYHENLYISILSILFMRFKIRLVPNPAKNKTFNSLYEILSYTLHYHGILQQLFQFSLWDSSWYIILQTPRIYTFNSLYEILLAEVYTAPLTITTFQFSLWDSSCTLNR